MSFIFETNQKNKMLWKSWGKIMNKSEILEIEKAVRKGDWHWKVNHMIDGCNVHSITGGEETNQESKGKQN